MMPKTRMQIKCHYSMIFPFSIFVLTSHVPTRLTELWNTALSCQSHHNRMLGEIFWMEIGATAASDSYFFLFFCMSELWYLLMNFASWVYTTLLQQFLWHPFCLRLWTHFYVLAIIHWSLRIPHSLFSVPRSLLDCFHIYTHYRH